MLNLLLVLESLVKVVGMVSDMFARRECEFDREKSNL